MKVVLFCGGLGMRLRDYSEDIPKPMVQLGNRPILWNIMKYYAYYGHKDFILCLGYKGNHIKRYFVEYEEYISNNFVMNGGGKSMQLLNSDLDEWNITFVDTGMTSNVGQRLMKVRPYLDDEEVFLANYADGLTDLPLDKMMTQFNSANKIASFLAYKPTQSFHIVDLNDEGGANSIRPVSNSGFWMNAGFFIFKKEIFEYINEGEDLVVEPFQRLIEKNKLHGYKYEGFWAAMDTFKDKKLFDDMYNEGKTPWRVWSNNYSKEKQCKTLNFQ